MSSLSQVSTVAFGLVFKMERPAGIEPASSAWKDNVKKCFISGTYSGYKTG